MAVREAEAQALAAQIRSVTDLIDYVTATAISGSDAAQAFLLAAMIAVVRPDLVRVVVNEIISRDHGAGAAQENDLLAKEMQIMMANIPEALAGADTQRDEA